MIKLISSQKVPITEQFLSNHATTTSYLISPHLPQHHPIPRNPKAKSKGKREEKGQNDRPKTAYRPNAPLPRTLPRHSIPTLQRTHKTETPLPTPNITHTRRQPRPTPSPPSPEESLLPPQTEAAALVCAREARLWDLRPAEGGVQACDFQGAACHVGGVYAGRVGYWGAQGGGG